MSLHLCDSPVEITRYERPSVTIRHQIKIIKDDSTDQRLATIRINDCVVHSSAPRDCQFDVTRHGARDDVTVRIVYLSASIETESEFVDYRSRHDKARPTSADDSANSHFSGPRGRHSSRSCENHVHVITNVETCFHRSYLMSNQVRLTPRVRAIRRTATTMELQDSPPMFLRPAAIHAVPFPAPAAASIGPSFFGG
jgi:hypothetical protein